MSDMIISKKLLVRGILRDKPKNPEKELKKLRDECNELDKRIRVLQFDERHTDFKGVEKARKELAILTQEYNNKSDRCQKLTLYIEMKQGFDTLKKLISERKISVSVAYSYDSADKYRQLQTLNDNLEFEFMFLCTHKRKFNLLDFLDTNTLRTLISGKCEVGLGLINCGKGCRRNNTLCLYIHT